MEGGREKEGRRKRKGGPEGGIEGRRARAYLEVLFKPTVKAVLDLKRGSIFQHCFTAGMQSPPYHVRRLQDRHLSVAACVGDEEGG